MLSMLVMPILRWSGSRWRFRGELLGAVDAMGAVVALGTVGAMGAG